VDEFESKNCVYIAVLIHVHGREISVAALFWMDGCVQRQCIERSGEPTMKRMKKNQDVELKVNESKHYSEYNADRHTPRRLSPTVDNNLGIQPSVLP
jgi:hypothetical protein